LLEKFSDRIIAFNTPKEKINFLHADIEEIKSYRENFDLVIAVDILPYVKPKNQKTTMEKIHACMTTHGYLIGSIFTDTDGSSELLRSVMRQLGAHFYNDENEFIKQFIEHSGFIFYIL
jgi:cyclopropane fatty-acyl-phospholipid synthase-like methyltransferase